MCLDTESVRVFLLQLSVNIDPIFIGDVDPTGMQYTVHILYETRVLTYFFIATGLTC